MIQPDVDMSTGNDADGDGVDDGVERLKASGHLQFKDITWSRKNVSGGGTRDKYWAKIQLTPSIHVCSDVVEGSNDKEWIWNMKAKELKSIVNSVQLKRGFHFKIYKAKGNEPNEAKDVMEVETTLYGSTLINNFGVSVPLKGDLNKDGTFKGKYAIHATFVPIDESKIETQIAMKKVQHVQSVVDKPIHKESKGVGGPDRGDESFNPSSGGHGDESFDPSLFKEHKESMARMRDSHEDMNRKIGKMELSMEKRLEALMSEKTADLRHSLEDLEAAMNKKPEHKKDQFAVFNVHNVRLPPNVKGWRTAHVQAWLAFVVELPVYMDSFLKASVDGTVLLHYIDEVTLKTVFNMGDVIHVRKVLDHIEELKERQEVINKKEENIRRATIELEKAETDAELKALKSAQTKAEAQSKKESSKKHKSKKSKTTSSSTKKKKKSNIELPTIGCGDKSMPNEQNEIERVRLARLAKVRLEEKRRKAAAAKKGNNIWKFEYTFNSDNFTAAPSSTVGKYANIDLFAEAIDSDVPQGKMRKRFQPLGPVIVLSKTATLTEVKYALQRAMFKLSSVLLDDDRRKAGDNLHVDDDLLSNTWSIGLEELETEVEIGQEIVKGEIALAAPTQGDESMPSEETKDQVVNPISVSINEAPSKTKDDTEPADGSWMKHPPVEDIPGDSSDYKKASDNIVKEKESNWLHHPEVKKEDVDAEYFEPNTLKMMAAHSPSKPDHEQPSSPNMKVFKLHKHEKEHTFDNFEPQILDRITLVYRALIDQRNNDARFIGGNDKLTRLKLLGGCETLLRVRLSWSQFDTLWTNLTKAKQELSLNEFKKVFGDLKEFEEDNYERPNNEEADNAVLQMKLAMEELCDTISTAGFTVVEMFQCFDRNGNGIVSFSEFCSLLRLIVGPTFDKKTIYTALLVLDTDQNKSISKTELLYFIYRFWRSKLDNIDIQRSLLADIAQANPHSRQAEQLKKMTIERTALKEAIKKNYTREMRNFFEEHAGEFGGAFESFCPQNDLIVGATDTDDVESPMRASLDGMGGFNGTAGTTLSAALGKSLMSASLHGSAPASPIRSPNKTTTRGIANSNRGEIMRFKIKAPGSSSPARPGQILTLPTKYDMSKNNQEFVSGERTEAILKATNEF
jgi:hypothetical protein